MSKYQLVFVLAAEVVKKSGEYVFPEVYEGLALDGGPRLKAAAKLFKLGIAKKIVCVGGNAKIEKGIQKSEIMKNRLVRYYKMPTDRVEILITDPNTEGNVGAIKEYLQKYKIPAKKCAFVTNFYHIPRSVRDFQKQKISIIPIPAESVLIADKEEREKFKNFYSTSAMVDRILSEIRGIWDKETGKYKSRRTD